MEIIFPDVPEYHFILRGLCSGRFACYPKFHCEPVPDFDREMEADIVFAPAPVAIMNTHDYSFMRVGNIFSYFSGPLIISPENEKKELYVRKNDFISEYYAKILLSGVDTVVGDGIPALLEPRIALLRGVSEYPKHDLYSEWGPVTDNLPFPLYSGMIRKSLDNEKGLIEDAIESSIKYALENSSAIINDIAETNKIENVEMLKRVIFQFINKDTLSISEEEIESLEILNEKMGQVGYSVFEIVF